MYVYIHISTYIYIYIYILNKKTLFQLSQIFRFFYITFYSVKQPKLCKTTEIFVTTEYLAF